MRRKMWVPGVLLLAGCGLQARLRQAPPDAGTERVHAGNFREVLEAVERTLEASGYARREPGWIAPGRRSILASTALGRAARVVVEEHPTDCRVWILARSAWDAGADGASEAALHRELARMLGPRGLKPPEEAVERERLSPLDPEASAAAAGRAALAAGFSVEGTDAVGGELRTLRGAREDGTRLFLALYRRPEGGTRLVADVRGPSTDAAELLDCALEEALARDAEAPSASEQ